VSNRSFKIHVLTSVGRFSKFKRQQVNILISRVLRLAVVIPVVYKVMYSLLWPDFLLQLAV
jgi:hypothetical protein